ncbi:hypothetical protein ABMX92_18845 [Vibrio vulnificus]|uniref:hypothetical protein n=1 Tax=Vibrio vulnificus TaxID=672 RepID=UPI004058E6B1|nr:glycosyltransferase [Vibrio vulnificus]
MKIVLFTQDTFGGTDRIFNDFLDWSLDQQSLDVVIHKSDNDVVDADLIILPTSEMYKVWTKRKSISSECRVCVWSMGHDAIEAAFYNRDIKNPIYTFIFNSLFKIFKIFSVNKKLFSFTDEVAANYFRLNIDDKFIFPIPIEVPEMNKYNCKNFKSLYWLGRVDKDFKVWSLIEVLNNMEKIQFDGCFNIIGDGDGIDLINQDDYSFNINMHGKLPYKEMERQLLSDASMVFAMGTSALEGCKFGIPTLLVNPLRKGEKNVVVRWAFESKGYSLGEFKLPNISPPQPESCFYLALENVIKEPRFYSERCFEYSKLFCRNKIYNDMMLMLTRFEKLPEVSRLFFMHYLSKLIKFKA